MIREITNLPGTVGLETNMESQEANTSDTINRKLEELEKRVKKLLETEGSTVKNKKWRKKRSFK